MCALRVDEAIDCQQGEAKRSYRGFLTVAIGIIAIVLLLVCLEEYVFAYLFLYCVFFFLVSNVHSTLFIRDIVEI